MAHSYSKVLRACAILATAAAVCAAPMAPAGADESSSIVLAGSRDVGAARAYQDAKDAPPSKYIKKVHETRTTANLNLRSKASTSSKSYGVMPKGTAVDPTGKKSGTWTQVVWKRKTGWASSKYLKTATYTEDNSVRYIKGYTRIYADADYNRSVGHVQFRTKVTLLDIKGSWSQIKSASYYGWVPSSYVAKEQPAKQYRYVQKSGPIYSHYDKSKSRTVGRIRHGAKYEYRRWDSKNRRDEILVGGKWVWTSMTNRPYVAPQYRYAQKDGATYSSASKSTSKKVGKIARGTKARWAAWDSKNRRDEVLLNGRWIWTDVTNRNKPKGYTPKVVAVQPYSRFASQNAPFRKSPRSNPYDTSILTLRDGDKVTVTGKAEGGWVRVKYGKHTGYVIEKNDLRKDGPYSVAVYGTLRTGQSAYNLMSGYQQKAMNQRFAKSSLYQMWNPNWTFLTNGSGTVVNEQFQYSRSKGPAMMKKLDIYESQLKYNGKPIYTRQRVSMVDGSQSWTYKTHRESEQLVKRSGRYIGSGDFLKRS
ncbi:SH3 domain-containing protein [Glutamicibacter sp. HZAU]|uniref:SH3 domain-containing protein n=1 Tax=Glutamicibacter sp. HZAU TaxID=2049891 RepID=UPI000FFC9510|nr:SH3 domain-containing protein [Glutamicibacter sp. HZAU]RWZ83757.1 hypothetical protein EKH49_08100 [Glutamicibacter sp. HZAU]